MKAYTGRPSHVDELEKEHRRMAIVWGISIAVFIVGNIIISVIRIPL